MTLTARLLASLIFAAIAIFLVGYTWLPARANLQRESGKITQIIAQPNTWYEVEIITASSVRLTCRTRRGWPLFGPSRCPLEAFESYLGQTADILHDGKRPFELVVAGRRVIDYAAHRQAQALAIVLAGLMLAMALWVFRRTPA
jgi:hypothetical protein